MDNAAAAIQGAVAAITFQTQELCKAELVAVNRYKKDWDAGTLNPRGKSISYYLYCLAVKLQDPLPRY